MYRFTWYCEINLSPSGPVNSKTMVQFSLDGSLKGSASTIETEWQAVSGWEFQLLAEGATPTLLLEIQRDPSTGGNDTAQIRKMKMSLERMGSV
jgi:hypothetical protein